MRREKAMTTLTREEPKTVTNETVHVFCQHLVTVRDQAWVCIKTRRDGKPCTFKITLRKEE